jgi:hypothetical protein
MPCTFRRYELDELSAGTVVNPIPGRMERLKNLICGGPWGGNDDIVLIYWKPHTGAPADHQWVAWVDKPTPKADPLPEASVSIAP